MPQAGIVFKLPKGSPAPQGFTFVRSLRTVDVYRKNAPAPVPKAEVDELIAAFGRMGIQGAQANPVDDLEAVLAGLQLGEGRKKSRKARKGGKKSRKGRKTGRKTRRNHI